MFTLIALPFFLAALYQTLYSLAGLFYQSSENRSITKQNNILVLIPGYKEDAVIEQTARAAAMQYYPKTHYKTAVIADSFQAKTIANLKALPVDVHEVSFEKSTKAKALRSALSKYDKGFDAVVILDADNLMKPDFLQRINDRLNEGHKAIQGQRSYKNWDSPMGALDGLSEMVNTHILCKGHSVLGLSARLAGSGMAFDYDLFKNIMQEVDAIGGFDKELELRFTQRGIHIAYDEEAVIYDEKVSKSAGFAKQRGRWLAAQYNFAQQFAGSAWSGLLKGNTDHFNKHLQTLLPPRLLLPVFLLLGTLLVPSAKGIWLAAFLINVLGFVCGIPFAFWRDGRLFKAVAYLPVAVFATFSALTWMPAASKRFLHTEHV